MIENLQDFISSLPPLIQWLGVMIAGAIPFVESYIGSAIGIIAGVHPLAAVAAAIIGNIVSMVLIVTGAHAVRSQVHEKKERSPKRQRLRRAFDRYGVAGVSLLGQTILPSQITSAAMVSFGAPKNTVIFWQTISITVWGIVFAVLVTLGVDLLGTR